jgi:hypothetical protein
MKLAFMIACFSIATAAIPARAGVKTAAARHVAEAILETFGKEAVKAGVERLTIRIEKLAIQHGEEVVQAIRKVGPSALRLIEEAGKNSDAVVKLMARFGDEAVWLVSRPKGMALFIKYGDDSAKAMIPHEAIAEPLLEEFGLAAARALRIVSPRNGRRLAIMRKEGNLVRMTRTRELLDVVTKHGDKVMEFIWNHKEALAGTALLAKFLAGPDAFLD